MILYKRHERHPIKWLLALIIFVLVLTVTYSDVFGLNLRPNIPRDWDSSSNLSSQSFQPSYGLNTYAYPDSRIGSGSTEDPFPPNVTEPTTLILLASGLGALHLMRRKKF